MRRPTTRISIDGAKPAMTRPITKSTTDAVSGASDAAAVGPRADRHHADDARGEGAGERDRVERRAVEVGAHDRHHRRHRQRLHPREEDQRDRADRDPDVAGLQMPPSRPTGEGANGEWSIGRSRPTSAPMRSTASRSTSGEQPKLMRTWPLPSSPKSGPNGSATFASRRILRAGSSPQPSAERSTQARNPASGIRYPAPGDVLGEEVGEQTPVAHRERRAARRATRRSPPRTPRRRRGRRTARCAIPPRRAASSRRARCSSPAVTISAHLRPARLNALLALATA